MSNRYIKGILTVMFFLCITLFGFNSVSYAKEAKTYDISKQNVIITKSGDYVITGSTDKYTIQVNKGVSVNITFKNVKITNPSISERRIDLFDIKSGAAVNLILTGTNILDNEYDYSLSAIHVPFGAKLIISPKSTGSLKAIGSIGGAAIGGSESDIKGGCGTIQIKGGTIYAQAGFASCAIGGGRSNRCDDYDMDSSSYIGGGDITISGGTVTAVCEKGEGYIEGAAAIGGTSLTRQGKITITGGVVTAISNEAGIGGEARGGKGNIITITGGTVIAKGDIYGSGIGNSMDPSSTIVTISGGTVSAKGDYGDRYVYDTFIYDTEEFRDNIKAYDIAAKKIVISGGHINAYTFSVQPVDPSDRFVYPAIINCDKGPITSITLKEGVNKGYGYKDMVSSGYLRIFMPISNPVVEIKSKNATLYKDSLYVHSDNSLWELDYINNLTVDLQKGTLELINGGCIYNNTAYRTDHILVTGNTTKNQIYVHTNKLQHQNLTFQDVTVDYTSTMTKDLFVIDNDVTLQLNLKNVNVMKLPDNSRGIFVGNDANLYFTGDEEKDSLEVTAGNDTNVIFTNLGDVVQYGGKLTFNLGNFSTAIHTGNYGSFSLCNGTFEAHSENERPNITGYTKMQINIYGGELIADAIGILETGNEETPNRAYFTMTGGSVDIADRISFYDYKIYGGTIKVRIFGCGTGCYITMYGGDVEIGAFVSHDKEDMEQAATVFGGTIFQRNDVPKEELDSIERYLS